MLLAAWSIPACDAQQLLCSPSAALICTSLPTGRRSAGTWDINTVPSLHSGPCMQAELLAAASVRNHQAAANSLLARALLYRVEACCKTCGPAVRCKVGSARTPKWEASWSHQLSAAHTRGSGALPSARGNACRRPAVASSLWPGQDSRDAGQLLGRTLAALSAARARSAKKKLTPLMRKQVGTSSMAFCSPTRSASMDTPAMPLCSVLEVLTRMRSELQQLQRFAKDLSSRSKQVLMVHGRRT